MKNFKKIEVGSDKLSSLEFPVQQVFVIHDHIYETKQEAKAYEDGKDIAKSFYIIRDEDYENGMESDHVMLYETEQEAKWEFLEMEHPDLIEALQNKKEGKEMDNSQTTTFKIWEDEFGKNYLINPKEIEERIEVGPSAILIEGLNKEIIKPTSTTYLEGAVSFPKDVVPEFGTVSYGVVENEGVFTLFKGKVGDIRKGNIDYKPRIDLFDVQNIDAKSKEEAERFLENPSDKYFQFEKYSKEPIDTEKLLQQLVSYEEQMAEQDKWFDRNDVDDLKKFFDDMGYKATEVSYAPELVETDKLNQSIFVYDAFNQEFHSIDDYPKVDVYEWWNGNKFETVVKREHYDETEVEVTKDYVSLDEMNENGSLNTDGAGLHQEVYKVIKMNEEVQQDMYMVAFHSQWSGQHSKATIWSEDLLLEHLTILERDVKEYMKEINAIEEPLYWYETSRSISNGTQPGGFVEWNDEKGEHGIVAYHRPLTNEQLETFEMKKWVEEKEQTKVVTKEKAEQERE